MNLDFSESQALLRESFETFFAQWSDPGRVRSAEPLGFDEELWAKVVEVGATTMGIPASQGGGGAEALDLVLVTQEEGRNLAPVPFVEAAAASNLLGRAGVAALVDPVLEGALPTLAVRPSIDGVWTLVPAAAVADIVIGLDGDELVALRRAQRGHRPYLEAPPNLGSSPIADVTISDPAFEPTVLARGKEALALYADALAEWKLLMAAALDGLRGEALDIGLRYVKARQAFGVPIGWFQAVQHRLADVAVAGDGARLLVYEAAWARDQGLDDAPALASMAFLFLSELALKTARESLQFHGGYGYTLDYDIQLFVRRARAWPLLAGDPRREYQRLACRLYPES
jgi:alkylation response protein AidB-like acyl-CoA dehydrogenase